MARHSSTLLRGYEMDVGMDVKQRGIVLCANIQAVCVCICMAMQGQRALWPLGVGVP